jgi:predicted MPP superfamily phosphohydrolase
MPSFDLISDIHLDFWVKPSWNFMKMRKEMATLIHLILPEKISDVLVIAGDLGHINKQNILLLKKLQEFYKHIIIVPGNHDYYLQTKSIQYKYGYNSTKRWYEMKRHARKLPSVHALEGDMVEINGVTYGGCGMWCDYQYGIQILNVHYNKIVEYWKGRSNDAVFLKGLPRLAKDMYYEEKKKLNKIIHNSDVIITHYSPDWSHAPQERRLDLTLSFYYFDGTPFFPMIQNKIWCFGHLHRRMDYLKHNCRFVNASLGYPRENEHGPKRAVTITI